jgi:hypothetical protein
MPLHVISPPHAGGVCASPAENYAKSLEAHMNCAEFDPIDRKFLPKFWQSRFPQVPRGRRRAGCAYFCRNALTSRDSATPAVPQAEGVR